MHVKIIQSQSDTWYLDKIGEEFEVTDTEIRHTKSMPYIITKGGGIFCVDYIKINKYPTLKSDYCK